MYPYRQKSKSKTLRSVLQIVGLGLITLIIFFWGLYHLRNDEKKPGGEETAANVSNNEIPTNSSGDVKADNLSSQEAVVKNLASGLEIGSAVRGFENGILYHTMTVNLPEINRDTEFYEGWLVRQAPYDFFSTGEMVTNSAGEFVLEWAGEHKDAASYDRVVITREAKNGDKAPGEHVAEGIFDGTVGLGL